MASMTIRNIADETKNELRLRAARRGASMEEEARAILRAVVNANITLEEIAGKRSESVPENAWESIRRLREKYGTFEIKTPERTELAGERTDFHS